jgi:hypothetical protein
MLNQSFEVMSDVYVINAENKQAYRGFRYGWAKDLLAAFALSNCGSTKYPAY